MNEGKRGLSGLYILLVLFAVMILFGGPAIVRMVNIILFGQCNVAPEADKMKKAIEEVCQGSIGDSKQADYPSCPVLMRCDNCATAAGKAVFRSALAVPQVLQFARNVRGTWNAGKNIKNIGSLSYVKNAKTFLSDFKYGLSDGKWKSAGNWLAAYRRAEGAGEFRAMLRQGRLVTARVIDLSAWGRVSSAAKATFSAAKANLLGYDTRDGPMQLLRRSPATAKYYFIAADPYELRPDLQQKVESLANDVVDNVESILCDPAGGECKSQGTVIVPVGLDVYLITKKEADTNGELAKLAADSGAAAGEASELLFELNTKLLSLFTAVNDQTYANAAFGQGSCMQPTSSGFNSIPSSYSEVQGACTLTSTVVVQEGEDCVPTDPNFSKCASPATVEEQDAAVERNTNVFLRRNHVFRFLEDVRGFLINKADVVEKKTADASKKEKIRQARGNIDDTLKDVAETASKVPDPWAFAIVGMGQIAEDVATIGQYEQEAGMSLENSSPSWYTTTVDLMRAVDELISGQWDYVKDADGNLVRTGKTPVADGIEQKQKQLLKSRNKAFDILSGLPEESCEKKSETVAPGTAGEMKVTVPMCSLISSCNQDDRIISQTGGCMIAAANLEKGLVKVGEVYFSMPAIPVAPIDYGTTIENLQVPIGLVSGLIGGEAGKAIATAEFARKACKGSPSEKTLIFCMKPASPVCALPGGCEVCFAAKCNTPITCSPVGAANLRVEKKRCEGGETIAFPLSYCSAGETITELRGPVKPI